MAMLSPRNLITRVRNAAVASTVAFLALPLVARAAAADPGLSFVSSSGLATTDIRTLVARIISYFLGLLGLIAVVLVLYAGYLWMTAGGNEEKVSTAKRILTQALIGLLIIVSAFAIAQFVFRALTGDGGSTNIGSNGCPAGQTSCCPPGQTCGITVGGGNAFRVAGITPAGAGRGSAGWPKNYALTVDFTASVSEASANANTVEVSKCNARLDGGAPAPYRGSNCGAPVAGTLTVEGSRVTFRPSGTPGENPTDFEGDFWYRIRLLGGVLRSTAGDPLVCPFQTADISSAEAGASYCERAVAYNALRDTQPPQVTLDAPASPPAFCPSPASPLAQVVATGTDDFLVAGVDFLLDGGTNGLVNQQGLTAATAVNGTLDSPFFATSVNVRLSGLSVGQHTIRAVARDGVPQSSTPAERTFNVVPGSCCNGTLDDGETANDCGGVCGSCSGQSCTTGSQCASGVCASGVCAVVPIIRSLSTYAAGPGSLVTIGGIGFGSNPGSITFLGSDTDGDGDAAGDSDDVTAQACAPQAWSDTSVVVSVPTGAVSGPVRLTSPAGSDRTDDLVLLPKLPDFVVNTTVVPGICYLSPSSGTAGSKVEINGAGFGQSVDVGSGTSTVRLGTYNATVATCAEGATDCGWSDSKIYVIAPPIPESEYPVTVTVGASGSNPSPYLLQDLSAAAVNPRVTGVIPEAAPVGSYVTIVGSGFGNRKGVVRFKNGADTAVGSDTVCSDSWSDNAIVVKVPPRYQGGLDVLSSAAGVAHGITVETPSPAKTSNADIQLLINNDPVRPGVCSISPDNGPAGTVVEVRGEGFGSRAVAGIGPDSAPRYSVDFFQDVAATLYSGWEDTVIGTVVAGQIDDAATWPKTGPVSVVANGRASANTVPFTVQDCRADGASCGAGRQCCAATGTCETSCEPVARTSAYGWQFSTSVLPTLPQVVERAQCSVLPSQMQSPSPAHDAQDACINAQLFFEFTRPLARASFTGATVKVEECGNGDTANCASPVTVALAPFGTANFTGCDGTTGQCRMFQAQPAPTYNNGLFKKQVWYRVTLVSNPTDGIGLRESGTSGTRYLDGDRDKKHGGDYITYFRARNSDDPCQISNVSVLAPEQLITQDETPVGFNAALVAGNCNLLQCGAGQPYTIDWLMNSTYLSEFARSSGACNVNVKARSETALGVPTRLTARVSTLPPTAAGPKEGFSNVSIKFAEPRVTSVTPVAECTAACINARIGATFSVPMNVDTLSTANVQILRCRNASCTAPFMPDLGGGITATLGTDPLEPPQAGSNVATTRNVTVRLSGNMQPSTFYMVRIRGGATGVKSKSGVALAGLNDGAFYSWKFRTNDTNTVCQVDRTTITPDTATLRYVGDRSGLAARAYSVPDQCSGEGQELDSAAYNWLWSFEAPNRVLQGFVNGAAAFQPPQRRSTPGSLVDTSPRLPQGCSAQCTLTGSQDVLPQCGDGRVNTQYETCDDGNLNDGDSCRNDCTLTGTTSAQCGNGVLNAGEQCESVGGTFPQGCKQPGSAVEGFATNIGCIFTGSGTANSTCGDGFVSDGESCDDGNAANGDGCSSVCLHEGSLRSCNGAPVGTACMNVCGNGVTEPGEDASCEPNPSAKNCNVRTCLKRGTPAGTSGTNVCGNGVTENGEDAGCDTADGVADHCTANCLLKGSSALYAAPSFCGDGIAGPGEVAACEAGVNGDAKLDSYQAVVANIQSGFDAGSVSSSNSTNVRAAVDSVPANRVGTSNVSLSCTCKNEPTGTQDAFCKNLNPSGSGNAGPYTDNLACANSGCCMPRPTVVSAQPVSFTSCRNAQVTVVFSEEMDEASVKNSLQVGFGNGSAPCPAGTVEVGPSFAMGEQPGLLKRVFASIANFVRNVILRPVFGVSDTGNYANQRFCAVAGTVDVRADGAPGSRVSVATFSPERAFPANVHVRVRLNHGAMSLSGVPLSSAEEGSEAGFRSYFGTGNDICAVSRVEVNPASVLLSSVGDTQTVTAMALAANGNPLAPTVDYGWAWAWDPASPTSPVVVTPRVASQNSCSISNACTDAGGCPCFKGGTAALCTVANGATTCTANVPTVTQFADVRVRGSVPAQDGSYEPVNSRGALPVNARAMLSGACILSSACTNAAGCNCNVGASACTVPQNQTTCSLSGGNAAGVVSSRDSTGTADVTVMLCRNPWPKYQPCTGPNCTADTWTPFRDTLSNAEFYYCRDTAAGQPALPCLKETPATVQAPAAGILREYLFTFETSVANCPNGPQDLTPWRTDAIGLRVAPNATHGTIRQWYFDRGFAGNPAPTVVDGYQALTEGRTVYVSAAAKTADSSGTNRLFTNAYVLSHNEGSRPETTSIFEQMVTNVDFNSNPELRDAGICRLGSLRDGAPVMCTTDADCRTDAAGVAVPGREAFTCDADKVRCMDGARVASEAGKPVACSADLDCLQIAEGENAGKAIGRNPSVTCDVPKAKLQRDVVRWTDLLAMRSAMVSRLSSFGRVPTLDAGTFLRSETFSAWPSWIETLGEMGDMPTDPLNRFGICKDDGNNKDFQASTCWNPVSRRFVCPAGSHVYGMRSINGTDFVLRSDFEFTGPGMSWGGSTCPELNDPATGAATAACAANPECAVDTAGKCNYRIGKLLIGSSVGALSAPLCVGSSQQFATGGRCGDGIVNGSEVCEPGQTNQVSCDSDPTGVTRAGFLPQVCNATCDGYVNQGRCSATSQRAGANCASGADCGTNGFCLLDTTFRCVGPAGNARNGQTCSSNAACNGGTCVSACTGGRCGDGLVQTPEVCDDGGLNGTYGNCNATCSGAGLACGDGQRQPSEACDAGIRNGQYSFDAVAGSNSCAWNCSAAGPRCGDGVVNSDLERCDGGFEEFRGFCNDIAQTGCDTSSQCPSIGTCTGSGSNRRCSNGSGVSCVTDADCVPSCGNFCATEEQRRRRSCNSNDPAVSGDNATASTPATNTDKACRWSPWICTQPGTCGNGRTETGEQCDDGNTDNNDACVIDPLIAGGRGMCKTPVCGDGHIYAAGGEECDDGANNGRACNPEYGITCNYCSSSCRVATVSGPFCGNGFIESPGSPTPGPEQCDGVNGLGGGLVCVSSRPEHQSFGFVTGLAGCRDNSCQHACVDPESYVCAIGGGAANADYHVSNGDFTDSCEHVPMGSNEYNYCESLRTTLNSVSEVLRAVGITVLDQRNHNVFRDRCDPDDDNDGVPDVQDCSPRDASAHPAYTIPARTIPVAGPAISIAAPAEVCGDNIDNDCDGQTDNVYGVSGVVQDGQTGQGLTGIPVQMFCAGEVIATTTTGEGGRYTVQVTDDARMARCGKRVSVLVNSSSGYCLDPATQAVNIDFNAAADRCNVAVAPTVIIRAPGDGYYTSVLTWTGNVNLASHLRVVHQGAAGGTASCGYSENKDASGRHILGCAGERRCIDANGNYGSACSQNSECGAAGICACASVDAGYAFLDVESSRGGPETTTIRLRPSAAYKYSVLGNAAYNSTNRGKVYLWGPHCAGPWIFDSGSAVTPSSGANSSSWNVFSMTTDRNAAVTIVGGNNDGNNDGSEGNGTFMACGPTPACPAP